jgi:23S rRNA pseudouridine1911/1915/1917 synthase
LATLRFRVADEDAGARLDRVLAARPEIGTRAAAERLVVAGAVRVSGSVRAKSHAVARGDEVVVDLPEPDAALPGAPVDVAVVLEDEHLLVVDKPAGVVVHPTDDRDTGTLAEGLAELGAKGGEEGREGIVHRLDRDTSGLLVVARSEEAHERLGDLIRRREVERRYLALVRGRPRSRAGRISAPIGRDRKDRTRMSLDTDTPRDAVTWFDVRELLDGRALLEVRLETGRTHQIRVHLAAIGLPVCGDPVYGVAGDLGLERQFLHAHRLRFRHPFTGAEIDVTSPLPADLDAALQTARHGEGPSTSNDGG